MHGIPLQKLHQMSGQKYKRTNFDDDENSLAGTPNGGVYDPAVAFKAGVSFWQKRSLMERVLLIFSLILLIVVISLIAVVVSKEFTIQHHKENEVCTTPVCVTVASTVINAMDTTVDPCEDFYQYACGGWIKAHYIPSGHSTWGTFGTLWKENQLVMRNALEKPLHAYPENAEMKAKMYYESCIDTNKTIQNLGSKPLLETLRSLGGWAISNTSGTWSPEEFDFQDLLQKIHTYGMNNFFEMWVGEDEKQSDKNILQIDQGGLMLNRDFYINKTVTEDRILSAYLKYATTVCVLLGAEKTEAEQQMLKVIEFEQFIANITVPQEQRRDEMQLYHKVNLEDMQKTAPFINWLAYVNNQLAPSDYKVNADEKVVLFAPDFLKKISEYVTNMLTTDEGKNVLNNYMKWHLVKYLVPFLSKPFRNAKKEFAEVLTGTKGNEEEWRYCISDTDGTVGFALGAMFVREAFQGKSKEKAEKMITQIKTAFINNLPMLSWMDDDTRIKAKDKAEAVLDMIGFPSYILNKTALDEKYKGLVIKPYEYYMNNVRAMLYNTKKNFDKLRKPPNKKSWGMTPPSVNAYYTPTKNEIVFPAGILQAPFYDKDFPKSLNFGAMGVVMGHELTHGFDDQGREYNRFGNLRSWWNNKTIENFKTQTKCMVDQYSSYTLNVSGDHVRGLQTLGENIADNGGLKSAYNAYVEWVKEHGVEQPLPGTRLTHRQLFFVAFSQVWCARSTKQAAHTQIISDPHSPGEFRVIGTLSNSKDFAREFQCKANSRMNPTTKCQVW